MPITTYAELKTAIADFLNRDDLSSTSATFISLAEADLQRKIRHFSMETTATLSASGQYTAFPADFLEPIRLNTTSSSYTPIELVSQGEMQQMRRVNLDTSGSPRYYAVTKGQLELYPTPDGTYDVDLYYYEEIPGLSDSATSNWLLSKYPDAYLYGSLVHSAPYLSDDNRITVWAALYQSAVDSINAESERVKFGGTGRRMKVRSY
jgi:hypothetical protein